MLLLRIPKTTLTSALLLLTVSNLPAQMRKRQKQWYPDLVKSLWVQYNPLSIMEPEIPVVATVLYKPGKTLGIALDAGFFIGQQQYSDEIQSYKGFRFKPELKFYPAGGQKGPRGFYFSLQGLLKKTTAGKERWFDQRNSNGQVIFSQLVNYDEKKFVYGLSILFGGEILMGGRKNWMLDLYCGTGIRRKQFRAVGLPDGVTIDYNLRNDRNWINIYRNGNYFSLPMGIKMGYRIF
ncbi:MAG: hypothetical protein ABIX01_11375 [Chitinophagaceae bacterium]